MKFTLFVSDLHLSESRQDITDQFLGFLQAEARTADALYILGDLFEAWIGDDLNSPTAQVVAEQLLGLREGGVATAFLHGNRDFLLGEDFAAKAGLELLPGPTVLNLYQQPVLVAHGDEYCVDDTEYMQFRALVRNPLWQQEFLAKSIEERKALAKQARAASKTQTATKAADIMDVNQDAIDTALRTHGVATLLHGHTHRPNVHRWESRDGSMTRIVLGDWYQQGSLVRFTPDGFSLETLERS